MKAGRENSIHIGIYGRCNAGKSSFLNYMTGADVALVSPEKGTTTDPVRKSCELSGIGPVVWIDTAGFDDNSPLAGLRLQRTEQTLCEIDLAVVVYREWGEPEQLFARELDRLAVPYIAVLNDIAVLNADSRAAAGGFPACGAGESRTCDAMSGGLQPCNAEEGISPAAESPLPRSADLVPHGAAGRPPSASPGFPPREIVIENIRTAMPSTATTAARPDMFGGRIEAGDTVLLVCPIDSGAPAGRLILPQVQTLRSLLDNRAVAVAVQPSEVEAVFASGLKPKLVVTDSQVFPEVAAMLPEGAELTSFSILLAAAKGDPELYARGLENVGRLQDGDKILILENCTYHPSCEDIGRVKIPGWLREKAGRELTFTFVSGLSPLPGDLSSYALAVQCGGCMVTRSQLLNRIRHARSTGVAVTNYGMLIRKIT